jgi:hypothetical protein
VSLWVVKHCYFAYCLHGSDKEITQSLCFRIEADCFCPQHVPNLAREPAHPREPLQEEAMNTLFQAEESSFRAAKRIAVVVAGMGLLGLALWIGVVMAWHVASGR